MTRADIDRALRDMRIRDAMQPCELCGHAYAAHTDRGRCKVRGCTNPTARAHHERPTTKELPR